MVSFYNLWDTQICAVISLKNMGNINNEIVVVFNNQDIFEESDIQNISYQNLIDRLGSMMQYVFIKSSNEDGE